MSIIQTLLGSIQGDAPVRNVVVSTHSTVVCSRRCGMSSTTLSIKPHGEEIIKDAGRLHLKSTRELAEYALSSNPLEASIGVAAINSIIDIDKKRVRTLDAAEVLKQIIQDKKISVVGHFPFIPRLKEVAEMMWVLEQNPAEGEHLAENANKYIPQSDVVAISGSTLINHTLEDLLALCRKDALVMIIGPSTPLSSLLFNRGISILSGILVTDEDAVVRAVSQGAILKQMEGIQRLVMVRSDLALLLTNS